jgi:hypothetical protein
VVHKRRQTKIGNTIISSDGDVSYDFGGFRLNSDGSSSWKMGDTRVSSDGSIDFGKW